MKIYGKFRFHAGGDDKHEFSLPGLKFSKGFTIRPLIKLSVHHSNHLRNNLLDVGGNHRKDRLKIRYLSSGAQPTHVLY